MVAASDPMDCLFEASSGRSLNYIYLKGHQVFASVPWYILGKYGFFLFIFVHNKAVESDTCSKRESTHGSPKRALIPLLRVT